MPDVTEGAPAKPKLIVQAGAQLDDWGTPPGVLDFVREAFGAVISLDLASNAEANELVKAARYYSLENPCPENPEITAGEVCWCNPPGPIDQVRKFFAIWERTAAVSGRGAFLIFNLDHLRGLTSIGPWYRVVFCRKRLKFVGAPSQYNHPSAVVLAGAKSIPRGFGVELSWP